MKVDIQGKEVAARYSIRAFMLFESITGKVFQGGTVTDEVTMMFATLLPFEPSISFEDVVNGWCAYGPLVPRLLKRLKAMSGPPSGPLQRGRKAEGTEPPAAPHGEGR